MANNCVAPSQQRAFSDRGDFLGFYDPPQYRQHSEMASRVARGILAIEFLDVSNEYLGCTEPAHVRDVLMAEGYYPRPELDPEGDEAYIARIEAWKEDYDRRRKAARERVRKRRSRQQGR